MKILAVETSCDETSLAVLSVSGMRMKLLHNVVASQINVHRAYGGVVPNLAKREHIRNLPILLGKIAHKIFNGIDLVAVTVGPGLEPALWTGINFAKDIAEKTKTPIVGVNHLEGHLYSFLLSQKTVNPKSKTELFPAIALIVSGGHTILLKMDDLIHYRKLGETRDDAAGEAFDKVARLLNLPYPGGPEIEKLAKKGNPDAIAFPRPMLDQKNYSFSFSGLKTAVLYYIRDHKESVSQKDVAASFQKAACETLAAKTARAAEQYRARSVLLSGGVAANSSLCKEMRRALSGLHKPPKLIVAQKKFCTDNAAIIAVAAYINHLKGKKRRLVASGDLSL